MAPAQSQSASGRRPPSFEGETQELAPADVAAAEPGAGAPAQAPRGPAAAEPDESLPRRLGNYELLEVLGRGGMGVVYRARHVSLDRLVALKLIRSPAPSREELLRFVAEAQVTGQIEHPNIVPVHEVGSDERGRPYFVMKLVPGRSLSTILRSLQKHDRQTRRQYPLSRLLSVFSDVCQAVAFAHSHGVLHNDLKPSNVMIGDFGEVLVMDWGLARRLAPAPDALSTPRGSSEDRRASVGAAAPGQDGRTEVVAGTPEYMSPERVTGEAGALAPTSDVYSLGAILFEILTFRPPHWDPDTARLLRKIAGEPVVLPGDSRHLPRAPKPLRAIVLKAVAREPVRRYASAQALLEDVRAFLEDRPVSVCPEGVVERAARLMRRHGGLIATAAAALVLLSVGAAVALWRLEASAARERTAFERSADYYRQLEKEARERAEAETRARREAEARARAEAEKREAEAKKREAEAAQLRQAGALARAIPIYLEALELIKRRQYDRGIQYLQAAIEIDPFGMTSALAYFARGEAFERKGTPADARSAIESFREADKVARLSNGKGDPRALLRCGEVAWRVLRDAPQALSFYEAAAGVDPENPFGKLGRAYALILRGREQADPAAQRQKAREALDLALQVIALGDFLWEAHYVAGSLYAEQELPGSGLRDLAKAYYHFSQALLMEPGGPDAWLGRAHVLRLTGDNPAALADFDTAVRLRPDWVPALQGRGELLLEAGRAKDALSDLERAFALAPDNYALRLHRASALLAVGKLQESESALSAALELHPEDARAWLGRGRARLAAGRFREAVSDFERACALDSRDLGALQGLAYARLKAGQPAEAARDFRRILERNPAGSEAWRGLAEALCAQGLVKDGLEAYQTYLAQRPADIQARLELARLQYADPKAPHFNPAAAVQAAREARRQTQDQDPAVLIVLAEALMAAGQPEESLQVIERAYTAFPNDPAIRSARERLRQPHRTK